MKYKVFIASRSYATYSSKTRELLEESGCQLDYNKLGRVYEEKDLLEIVESYDCLIVGLDKVTAEVIKRGRNLKVIGKNGVGVDNIDLKAADKSSVSVVNIPGANSQSVADLAVGLMLALSRSIISSNNRTKAGIWKREIGNELWNKKVGIIGTGDIGYLIASRLINGFNCKVLAFDPKENKILANSPQAKYVSLDKLIKESDLISLNIPLNDRNCNLIDRRKLKIMKETAFLVNTSRGGVVNEADLYIALKAKEIAGAASDVFVEEPPGQNKLFQLDNFIATPHIGAFTYEASERAGFGLAKDIIAVLNDKEPTNLVNNPK